MDAPNRFTEQQSFRGTWVWWLTVAIVVIQVVGIGLALFFQLLCKIPVGDHPLSDEGLLVVAGFSWSISALIWWLVGSSKLTTSVDDSSLIVQFRPFHRKPIVFSLDEIRTANAVTYKPIRDYGGWGIRYGVGGKAYNVSGNRGVQIVFWNDKRLLIGSNRADEFAVAIQEGLRQL